MGAFTLVVLAASLAYAAVQNAGVTPDFLWTLAAIGTASAIYFLWQRKSPLPRLDRTSAIILGAFVGIPALQILPLPASLVGILSPARLELLRATEPLLGAPSYWLTLSIVPEHTLIYLLTLGGMACLLLVIREISTSYCEKPYAWAPVWPLLAIAGFEGALGFYQAYAEGGEGIARGTYTNRDHYAGLLEMVIPFAVVYPIAILQRDRKRHESPAGPALRACVVLAVATVILIGIIHSLSRMAFLATLASLFVSGAIAISLRESPVDPPLKASVWRKWVPIASVGVIVLLGFVFLPTDPLIKRFSELATTEDISADTRAQIWRDTVGLVKAFPIFGCGLGGYESAFLRYKSVAPMNTVDYAHNDYLQVLAEVGLIGFALGLALALRVFFSAVRGAIYAASRDERFISIGCIGSLTAILLHSLVDFNMYVPANALAVAWIGGMASMRLRVKRRRKRVEPQPDSVSHQALSA